MDQSLAAPLIYEQTYIELIRTLYQDELGDELFKQMIGNKIIPGYHIYELAESMESAWCDNVKTTDKTESFEDNIFAAYISAIDTLTAMMGEDPEQWQYGDIHTLTIEHPMGGVDLVVKLFDPNLGPYPVGGSFHTVAPYTYPLTENYKVNHGASQRHVFSLANWDASKTVIPTGTSGIPASPYYGNQTDLYVNFKYHDDPFSREAVDKKMKYKAVFE